MTIFAGNEEASKAPKLQEEIVLPSLHLPPKKGGYQLPPESHEDIPIRKPVLKPPPSPKSRGTLLNSFTVRPKSSGTLLNPFNVQPDLYDYNYEDPEYQGDDEGDRHGTNTAASHDHNSSPGANKVDPEGAPLDADGCFTSPSGAKLYLTLSRTLIYVF